MEDVSFRKRMILQRSLKRLSITLTGSDQRLRGTPGVRRRPPRSGEFEDNIHDIGKYLPFERVMRPEIYLGFHYHREVHQGRDPGSGFRRWMRGLAVSNEVDSPYAGDMKKIFLGDLCSIGAAMAKETSWRQEEQNRRLYQERNGKEKGRAGSLQRKAAAEKVMAAGRQEPVLGQLLQNLLRQKFPKWRPWKSRSM